MQKKQTLDMALLSPSGAKGSAQYEKTVHQASRGCLRKHVSSSWRPHLLTER